MPLIAIALCALAVFSCVSARLGRQKKIESFYKSVQDSNRYEIPFCPPKNCGQILERTAYVLCYNESREQADWAAYVLDADKLEKNAKRSNDFRPDFEVTTGSAALEDYQRSGYDRGHLVPAGDMAHSAKAMSETFLLSNMSPQPHAFNEGVWNSLEQYVRSLAKKGGRVYVATGPVFEKKVYPTIGANKVAVPEYFYKALLIEEGGEFKMEAYAIPSEAGKEDFRKYRVSVDEIEKRTGIDFFYLLDDEIENRLEAAK